MGINNNIAQLMNYSLANSNSNNYSSSLTSSSPESFPDLMNNGIIVEYKSPNFISEILSDEKKKEEDSLIK